MHEFGAARKMIETMIWDGDLEGLLRQAEAIHSHRCPNLALGVKAGRYAMTYLGGEGFSPEETVAIIEGNDCFIDGVQVVTGCTFGNGNLILKDLGKTAVTVARREDGKAVRLVLRPDFREVLFNRYPAAGPLFDKVLIKNEGTAEDRHRFLHLWEAVARRELEEPLEEQLRIEPLTIQVPKYLRSFAQVICSRCGEGVLESKARVVSGQTVCLACAGEKYYLLTARGVGCICTREF